MIIDLKNIKRLRKFLESEENEPCLSCWNDNEGCKDQDICERYTPNALRYSSQTDNLVYDLLDTIEYLINKSEPN